MIYKLTQLALMSLLLSGSAIAGEAPKTVIELFTSQGCSSCPPANEFVGGLADDPDKLVLSYGVTYWDYLGWKDRFGDPEFTKRQKEYGAALGMGYVYTPQIILNGSDHNSRYKSSEIEQYELLNSHSVLDLTEENGYLSLNMNARKAMIVTYRPGWQSIDVKRGENGGRTLRVANVVKDIQTIKKSGPTKIEIADGYAYAAIIHDPEDHHIVRASVLKF